MRNKNGVSLIVLIVTIIVIIILAAAVILTLNKNNPIDSSRVAQLVENRANINSSVQLYYGKQMVETGGVYDANEIFTQSYVVTNKKALVTNDFVTISNVKYYKIDENNIDDLIGIKKLPALTNANWYLDIESGLAYLIFDKDAVIPDWMYTDDTKLNMEPTLFSFVKQKLS